MSQNPSPRTPRPRETAPDDTDALWKRAEADSPCVKVCVIEPKSRLCTGCLRTIDEIGGWSALSGEARRAIMATLPGRAAQLTRRRGGRAARLAGPSEG